MPRTYVITGASRGLGLELVRQLRNRGERVFGTVRGAAASAAVERLGAAPVMLDVTDPRAVDALPGLVGVPVDVLINNAGVSSEQKTLASLDAADMERVLRVNSVAPIMVARALLPRLRESSTRRIVHLSSALGSLASFAGGSSYAYRASKAALNMLNLSLAHELKPEGFTCVAMHPGWVRTDMGGPEAPLSPAESVASMISTLDTLHPGMNGAFLNHDGRTIPW